MDTSAAHHERVVVALHAARDELVAEADAGEPEKRRRVARQTPRQLEQQHRRLGGDVGDGQTKRGPPLARM